MNTCIQLLKKYGFAITLCIISLTIMNLIFDTVCLSTLFLGIPCPACGITRATKLMLLGQFRESFEMHPLLILVIIGTVLCPIFQKYLNKGRLYIRLYVIMCVIIFIGFYAYRMQMYFPNVEPMTYRENNIFANIRILFNNIKK
ncbi:MAG: DUF2752 domain-containing protein [Clostridiales bacterium]|nr:DUF2752 domain-containing protein [Clostridiales bacterium]